MQARNESLLTRLLGDQFLNNFEEIIKIKRLFQERDVALLQFFARRDIRADNQGGDLLKSLDLVQAIMQFNTIHTRELIVKNEQIRFH